MKRTATDGALFDRSLGIGTVCRTRRPAVARFGGVGRPAPNETEGRHLIRKRTGFCSSAEFCRTAPMNIVGHGIHPFLREHGIAQFCELNTRIDKQFGARHFNPHQDCPASGAKPR